MRFREETEKFDFHILFNLRTRTEENPTNKNYQYHSFLTSFIAYDERLNQQML